MSFSSKTRLALALAAVVSLGACGRYGDLEPPSAATASPTPENGHSGNLRRASQHKITPPQKDFVLDPLLK